MAARYSARCSSRTLSTSAVLATRHSPALPRTSRVNEARPFPHRRFCCPRGSSGTTAASDSLPALGHFPGTPVIGPRRSDRTLRRPPGRGGPPQFPPSPSERSAPSTPRSSSGLRSRLFTPSMAFARTGRGSALPRPTASHDAAGFASCCGPLGCTPPKELDAALRPRAFPPEAGSLLPGLLAATRTGPSPAGDDELVVGSRLTSSTSNSLGALPSRNTRWRLQNLVGLSQFAHLALQVLEPLALLRCSGDPRASRCRPRPGAPTDAAPPGGCRGPWRYARSGDRTPTQDAPCARATHPDTSSGQAYGRNCSSPQDEILAWRTPSNPAWLSRPGVHPVA